MVKSGKTYDYHVSGHGDVTALTDENGNVVAEYQYDAWGNIISSTGSMKDNNPYRYAGYRYDEMTGLYYLMARYYDATDGRFITLDTFHGFEDDPQSLNLYTYTKNNPIKYIDPDGHNPVLIWLGGLGVRMAIKYGPRAASYIKNMVMRHVGHLKKTYDIQTNPKSNQKWIVQIIHKKTKQRLFAIEEHGVEFIQKNGRGKLQRKVWHFHAPPDTKKHNVPSFLIPNGYRVLH